MGWRLREGQVDDILKKEKFITEELKWEKKGTNKTIHAKVHVKGMPTTTLDFIARLNPRNRYAFVLLYRYKQVLVKYDQVKGHINPREKKKLDGPHKHRYKDGLGDKWAYVVDNIAPNDVNIAIYDFFDECNIVLQGFYHETSRQTLQVPISPGGPENG
ncbi:MAG: hypothetical protein KAW09_09370 [Thermoplasmata archaeon]|nr:hypothetical protein [Thermoplasmata archaeon]MCK4455131.1 hypothetical protein [Thermoplasmata archaeon]